MKQNLHMACSHGTNSTCTNNFKVHELLVHTEKLFSDEAMCIKSVIQLFFELSHCQCLVQTNTHGELLRMGLKILEEEFHSLMGCIPPPSSLLSRGL